MSWLVGSMVAPKHQTNIHVRSWNVRNKVVGVDELEYDQSDGAEQRRLG